MKKIINLIALGLTFVILLSSCSHEHSFNEWKTTENPTCVNKGLMTRVCSCGEEETKTISETGHTFDSWQTQSAATCETKGFKTRKCYCGTIESAIIPASGHNWKNATCTEAKTCKICFKKEGISLGHNKGSDGYCTRCYKKLSINMKTVVSEPDDSAFGFSFNLNSVNGVKVLWVAKNLTQKTIKYCTLTFYFFNAVGDPAYSSHTGKSTKTVTIVGPIAPEKFIEILQIVDYVPACAKVSIGEMTVEYTDGTSDTGWYGHYTTIKW